MADLVNKLVANNSLSKGELEELLKFRNKETTDYLFEKALIAKEKLYGKKITNKLIMLIIVVQVKKMKYLKKKKIMKF